jgi:VCBS repeat-containing protein
MKKLLLISVMAMLTIASYGRKHVENATVVADTIYYAENMQNVVSKSQANYYRLLMTEGTGLQKRDVFQDFYLNGNLKAEGGYSFVDLGNDKNTVFDGEITTYYVNGKEKWHGTFKNGKRDGYFTLMMRDGSVAVAEYVNGVSKHDYFTVTRTDGTMSKRPMSEIKSLLQ